MSENDNEYHIRVGNEVMRDRQVEALERIANALDAKNRGDVWLEAAKYIDGHFSKHHPAHQAAHALREAIGANNVAGVAANEAIVWASLWLDNEEGTHAANNLLAAWAEHLKEVHDD